MPAYAPHRVRMCLSLVEMRCAADALLRPNDLPFPAPKHLNLEGILRIYPSLPYCAIEPVISHIQQPIMPICCAFPPAAA